MQLLNSALQISSKKKMYLAMSLYKLKAFVSLTLPIYWDNWPAQHSTYPWYFIILYHNVRSEDQAYHLKRNGTIILLTDNSVYNIMHVANLSIKEESL